MKAPEAGLVAKLETVVYGFTFCVTLALCTAYLRDGLLLSLPAGIAAGWFGGRFHARLKVYEARPEEGP